MNIDPKGLPPAVQRQIHADKRGEIAPSQERRLRGKQAQAAGGDFEGAVLRLCVLYKAKRIARLRRMPVPTVPAPKHDQRTHKYRVLSGQAPFDLYGYYIDGCRYIGVELKSTAKPEPSLAIVAAGLKPRGGLQEHQMNALASVAACGGTSRVVWSRAGEIGVLYEPEILAADERFYEGGRGSRSIRWEMFKPPADWDWLGLTGKRKEK